MSAEALWNGYMWFRRRFFSPACILQRVRRSGVRPLQTIVLNLGYWRAVHNTIPGHPIPVGEAASMIEPSEPSLSHSGWV
jgi:hypothetical protein